MSGKTKKRSKSYYTNNFKRRRGDANIQVGQRGFLITCNNRETECTREACSLLNEYADRLYGVPLAAPAETAPLDSEDILDAVQNEIANLKNASPVKERFQIVNSGIKNCLFIKTSLPDPCHLIHEIMTDVLASQKQRARFIQRLMPVTVVCKAYVDDITKATTGLLEQHFKSDGPEGKTFAIIFRSRYNEGVSRNLVIPALAKIIQDMHPKNKANLTNPELAVVVEVMGKHCLMGVLPDFFRFKKYNLLELTTAEKKPATSTVCKPIGDQVSVQELKLSENESVPPGLTKIGDVEPVTVDEVKADDVGQVKANDVEPVKADDIEPINAENNESVQPGLAKIDDVEPVMVDEVKADDVGQVKVDDVEPVKTEDIKPINAENNLVVPEECKTINDNIIK